MLCVGENSQAGILHMLVTGQAKKASTTTAKNNVKAGRASFGSQVWMACIAERDWPVPVCPPALHASYITYSGIFIAFYLTLSCLTLGHLSTDPHACLYITYSELCITFISLYRL